MLGRIGEAIGRDEAIEAGAAHPVVAIPVLFLEVDVLNAGPRGHNVLVSGLGAVTPVMRHVHAVVGWEGRADLARAQVTRGEQAGVTLVG